MNGLNEKLVRVLKDKGYWPEEVALQADAWFRRQLGNKFNSHTQIELCDYRTVEYRRGFRGDVQTAELKEHALTIEGGTFYLSYHFEPTHNILYLYKPALASVTGSLS